MINSIPTLQKLSLQVKLRFFAYVIKAKNIQKGPKTITLAYIQCLKPIVMFVKENGFKKR